MRAHFKTQMTPFKARALGPLNEKGASLSVFDFDFSLNFFFETFQRAGHDPGAVWFSRRPLLMASGKAALLALVCRPDFQSGHGRFGRPAIAPAT